MLSWTGLKHIMLGEWECGLPTRKKRCGLSCSGLTADAMQPWVTSFWQGSEYMISAATLQGLVLSGSRTIHTHDRPHNRCCLELMKGKCREACLPQPANQLLPTSTDSNSTTITTTHLTLNIDMPLTLCKFFWNRMSPSQLLTRLWELDCGADLVVICGPGRETVLRSNGWRLPHTYAAHIEAQITDFS